MRRVRKGGHMFNEAFGFDIRSRSVAWAAVISMTVATGLTVWAAVYTRGIRLFLPGLYWGMQIFLGAVLAALWTKTIRDLRKTPAGGPSFWDEWWNRRYTRRQVRNRVIYFAVSQVIF